MNKVIYLESDEEIISIIDRLKNISEEKVALVVPVGALIFSSAVNLKLLKEEARKQKKDISIVTTDGAGRNIASQLGFTVYEDLSDAREIKEQEEIEAQNESADLSPDEEEKEEIMKKRKIVGGKKTFEDEGIGEDLEIDLDDREVGVLELGKKNSNYRPKPRKNSSNSITNNPKFWILSACAIVIVLFLLVFVFPKATVYINVYAEETEVDIPFQLSSTKSVLETENTPVVPATWDVAEKEISIKMDATGQKNIGDKAKGEVVIYNRSGRTFSIPANSEFVSKEGKAFTNPEEISVSGAIVSDFGELIPGKSSTKIESKDGGTDNNIGPSRFNIPVAGTLGALIYGISEESFSGGTDKEAKVVTKEDIEKGKEKAKEEAENKLEEEFGIKGEKIFVKGLATSEISDAQTSKKEDEEADSFDVKVKAKFSFLAFRRSDFDKLFNKNKDIQVSGDKVTVGDGYRSVEWEVKSFDQKKKEAEVIGKAVVMTAAKVSEDFLKSKITSLSIAELRSVLSEYPQVELVRVKFFPPLLLSSIPSNERNVTIKINYIEQSLSLGAWDLNTG